MEAFINSPTILLSFVLISLGILMFFLKRVYTLDDREYIGMYLLHSGIFLMFIKVLFFM